MTSSEAEAKSPLWQMDLRHKLGLEPGMTDPVSMLIWHSIYGSGDSIEAAERIENHIEELQRALRVIREES